ncbi:hypothetical protein P692DRAFT_20820994 [Suillus brevipes Sb2]|nr:hypothetical protein P692DRAFT_20820994 [Suillus brevipes Sb2]
MAAAGPSSEAVTVASATVQPNITMAAREDIRSRDITNKAVRLVPSIQGLTRWPSFPKDVSTIWQAVMVMHSAMMTFARQNIVLAYDLLPPHDCNIPPDQIRVNRVNHIV